MQTPVSASPARIARSTGAAPRQRGSSEKCTLSIGSCSSTGRRISWPKATTTPRSASTSSASTTSVVTGRPSSMAAAFTGVGVGALRRPRRRSGPDTTSTTSWPAATSARRLGTASSGVPRKTMRCGRSGGTARGSGSLTPGGAARSPCPWDGAGPRRADAGSSARPCGSACRGDRAAAHRRGGRVRAGTAEP